MTPDAQAQTVYSTHNQGPDGTFSYEYQTDNGIKVKQDSIGYGANKVVRGYYSYIGTDGVPYTVNYIADRFGYRAYGAHLPTQPDAVYDQTKLPVYNRPVNNNQYYVSSTPGPLQVQPINQQQNHQHQTQTVYYPQQSHPIYVADSTPTLISITPKPSYNQVQSQTQLPLNILPPLNNFGIPSSQYSNQPFAWTTSKPAYNVGYGSSTPRPYVSY